jgi:hypothetical protein
MRYEIQCYLGMRCYFYFLSGETPGESIINTNHDRFDRSIRVVLTKTLKEFRVLVEFAAW